MRVRIGALSLLLLLPYLVGWTQTLTFEDGTWNGSLGFTNEGCGAGPCATTETCTAATGQVNSGTYAFMTQITSDDAEVDVYKDMVSPLTQGNSLYIRYYIRHSAGFSYGSSILKFFRWSQVGSGSGNYLGQRGGYMAVTTESPADRSDPGGTDPDEWTTDTVASFVADSTSRWKCVEIQYTNWATASQHINVFFDGHLRMDWNKQNNNINLDRSRFFDTFNTLGVSGTVYLDDIIITSDTPTNTCDSYPCIGLIESEPPPECTTDEECDDSNPCTDDDCTVELVCTNTNDNTNTCDDGAFCTGDETCAAGVCNHAGDPCSAPCETCNEGTNACDVTLDADADTYISDVCVDGNDCDDSLAAVNPGALEGPAAVGSCSDTIDNDCDTTIDALDLGCQVAGNCNDNTDCNDDNPCTDDTCEGDPLDCVYTNDNTNNCDDDVYCNGAETCAAGVCGSAGDPCAAGAECNVVCSESDGWCYDPTGTSCTPDASPTTDDICNGQGACVHVVRPSWGVKRLLNSGGKKGLNIGW